MRRLDRSPERCVVGERDVRSIGVVMASVLADQAEQMALAEHNHVVKELSPQRPDESLGVPVLPDRWAVTGPHCLTPTWHITMGDTPSAKRIRQAKKARDEAAGVSRERRRRVAIVEIVVADFSNDARREKD